MDLIAIAVVTLLLQPLIYGVSVEPVRIALGLFLVLFFPGYVLISALYPRREQLSGVERIALGLGLSLALVPLIGLALNFSPWGIRLTPIVLSLSLWTLVVGAVAWRQRRTIAPHERFDVRLEPIIEWARRPRRRIDLAFNAALVVAVLAVVGTVAWKIQQPTPGEAFTEFYILGAQGMLQDYPTDLRSGETQGYNVGIINHEGEPTGYDVRAFVGEAEVGAVESLTLSDDETWEGVVEVTPGSTGERQKLEFRLFRAGDGEAYRTVHLFVDVR